MEGLISRESTAISQDVNFNKVLINAQKRVLWSPYKILKLELGAAERLEDCRLYFVPNETRTGDLICEGPESDITIILRRHDTMTKGFRIIVRGTILCACNGCYYETPD